MTHPLTDEICEEITFWRNPCDNMRAAADWQLEQVFEWINNNLYYIQEDGSIRYHNCVNPVSGKYVVFDHYQIIDDLRKAMRPQVVDLPQANSDVCGEEGIERALQRTFEENDELMRKLADS